MESDKIFIEHFTGFCNHFLKYTYNATFNGHNTGDLQVDIFNFFSSQVGFNKPKLLPGDFLEFTKKIIIEFGKLPLNELKIHLNKDNNAIFRFLSFFLFTSDYRNTLATDPIYVELISIMNSISLPFGNAIVIPSASVSSQPTSSQTSETVRNKEKTMESLLQDTVCKQLYFKTKKLLRYRNHLSIFAIHENKGTTPATLFYGRFPPPFFVDDDDFINEHNKIISETQKRIIDLTTRTLKEKESIIETEIKNLHNNDQELNDAIEKRRIQPESVYKGMLERVEGQMSKKFTRLRDRAERCVNQPYKKISTDQSIENLESTRYSRHSINNGYSSGDETTNSQTPNKSILKKRNDRNFNNNNKHRNNHNNNNSHRHNNYNNNKRGNDQHNKDKNNKSVSFQNNQSRKKS